MCPLINVACRWCLYLDLSNLCKLFHSISQTSKHGSLWNFGEFETSLTQHHYHHSTSVSACLFGDVLKLFTWSYRNKNSSSYDQASKRDCMSYKELWLYLAMLSTPSNSGKVEGLLGIPYYNYHDSGRDQHPARRMFPSQRSRVEWPKRKYLQVPWWPMEWYVWRTHIVANIFWHMGVRKI